MAKEKKALVPRIRFPGCYDENGKWIPFIGEWEQHKVGDVVDGFNKRTVCEDEFPVLSSTMSGIFLQRDYFQQEVSKLTNVGYKIVPYGFITYRAMSDTDIFRFNIQNLIKFGIVSPAYPVFCVHNDVINSFLVYQMNYTSSFLKQLKMNKEGGTRYALSFDKLKGLIVYLPVLLEQKQVSVFLDTVSNLIVINEKKCETLKKLKKCMLQKMFPQKGETVPRIRFKGTYDENGDWISFTDAWEQRKLGELVKNVAKKNKDNLDLESYAVTNDRGFIVQKDAHDDFGYMSNVDRTAYNIVPPNSFAYNPARINVGSLGYYEGAENVIVSSLYEVFQTVENIDDKFLLQWFKSDAFPRWIEKFQEGSVRLYFYFDKLVQCQMMVPSLEEQKRISKYLDGLDHLITLSERKCETLKRFKKCMLQKMFV